jgi:two-component system phosphate regulon response regulator OmpR
MKNKYRILVVDDDTRLRNLLVKFLEENGFATMSAKDSTEAKEFMMQNIFDLLIVDVMMPKQNGIEFSNEIRSNAENQDLAIIMLTARGEVSDRIEGLEAGADDYLLKPFEPKELLLRIHNIFKRSGGNYRKKRFFNFGEFRFCPDDSSLEKKDEFVHITEGEAKILNALCLSQGRPITREDLAALCGQVDERTIDVQIMRLRKKIEQNPKKPRYLQTARNLGYLLIS